MKILLLETSRLHLARAAAGRNAISKQGSKLDKVASWCHSCCHLIKVPPSHPLFDSFPCWISDYKQTRKVLRRNYPPVRCSFSTSNAFRSCCGGRIRGARSVSSELPFFLFPASPPNCLHSPFFVSNPRPFHTKTPRFSFDIAFIRIFSSPPSFHPNLSPGYRHWRWQRGPAGLHRSTSPHPSSACVLCQASWSSILFLLKTS